MDFVINKTHDRIVLKGVDNLKIKDIKSKKLLIKAEDSLFPVTIDETSVILIHASYYAELCAKAEKLEAVKTYLDDNYLSTTHLTPVIDIRKILEAEGQ